MTYHHTRAWPILWLYLFFQCGLAAASSYSSHPTTPPPPPNAPPTVDQFKHNLQLHSERNHHMAHQQAKDKQIKHYERHKTKAQQLYQTHVHSISQRDAMKRSDPSMADAVDVYYNTIQSEYNVHKCASTSSPPSRRLKAVVRSSKITLLHADRVQDGICDCCDGSDEATGECPTVCPSVRTVKMVGRY